MNGSWIMVGFSKCVFKGIVRPCSILKNNLSLACLSPKRKGVWNESTPACQEMAAGRICSEKGAVTQPA
jgi:hypothetical protein